MNKLMTRKVEEIARELGADVVRADDDAVILSDECGITYRVYRTQHGWIIASRHFEGWKSSDATRMYLKNNQNFAYFAAHSLDALAESVRAYKGPVSALRSLARMACG